MSVRRRIEPLSEALSFSVLHRFKVCVQTLLKASEDRDPSMEPGLRAIKALANQIPTPALPPAQVSTGMLGSYTFANPGVLGFPGELDCAGRPALAPSFCAREKKMARDLSGILITLM